MSLTSKESIPSVFTGGRRTESACPLNRDELWIYCFVSFAILPRLGQLDWPIKSLDKLSSSLLYLESNFIHFKNKELSFYKKAYRM